MSLQFQVVPFVLLLGSVQFVVFFPGTFKQTNEQPPSLLRG